MALKEILILIACIALVDRVKCDDAEHKKRGAGKTTGVNAIPSSGQKPEFTYNIFNQNPNTQGAVTQNYQAQIPSSFYQNPASQYYTLSNSANDGAISHSNPQPVNIALPQSASQFLPLNFVPNPGYQAKYQIIPSKSANGHLQMAIYQPSAGLANYQLPQAYTPTNQNAPANLLQAAISPQGHFNFPSNYHPLSVPSPYLGQTAGVLFPQLNPQFYGNLLYPSNQNFYYPTNSQPKHNYPQSPQASTSNELQASTAQTVSKEENDIAAQSSDLIHYSSGRSSSYTKVT